jgi:hypothetical protein
MVADSQPTKYPPKINNTSFMSGVALSFHQTNKITAQTIKSPMLYIFHDLDDLLISQVYSAGWDEFYFLNSGILETKF